MADDTRTGGTRHVGGWELEVSWGSATAGTGRERVPRGSGGLFRRVGKDLLSLRDTFSTRRKDLLSLRDTFSTRRKAPRGRSLIRRVVREELSRLTDTPTSMLYDWRHEGPDDREGDEELAREAADLSRRYREAPEELTSLENFEKELALAEAAGELPD